MRSTYPIPILVRSAPALLNCQQRRRVLPHLFQAIERPLVDIKDVDNDIAVVDQDPAGRRGALNPPWEAAFLFKLFHHIAMDGPKLAFVFAGADDKAIGHGRGVMDVDHDRVLGRSIGDDFGDPNGQVAARRIEWFAGNRDFRLFRQKGVFGCDEVPP